MRAQEGEGDLARRGRVARKKAHPCSILGLELSPADCVVYQVPKCVISVPMYAVTQRVIAAALIGTGEGCS